MRTIAHISDLHFGRDDPAIAEALVAELQALCPSLVIASGDFTQRARSSQYRAAAAYMARLPGPQLVVPGNHDIPLYDLVRRFFLPLHRYRQHISHDLRPVFEDEELLVLGINTARSWTWTLDGFWKDGHISEDQLLDVQLRARDKPEKLFRVVVTHHPFIPPPGERPHGIVHGAGRALEVMEHCRVDLLLAGHLHMGYSGDVRTHHEAIKRSILSVQAGTAISTRRRDEPNAFNLITVKPDCVRISVRAWTGREFAESTITAFARRDGQWVRQE
jgi:3',5'-cyclic AMP phosphodiesterase CpdA